MVKRILIITLMVLSLFGLSGQTGSAHSGSYLWCGIGGSMWRTYYWPALYLANGGHTHQESTFYAGRCFE